MKIILLGPPGSGKGTVAQKLTRDFSLYHLSAGQILREEVEKDTTLGRSIKEYIEKGNLVPSQFVVEIVKLEVGLKDNYMLDGFPRSLDQAKGILDLKIDLVIFLDVAQQEVVERLSKRRVCAKGDHSFHLKFVPPKEEGICDYDGSALVQRKDDHADVISERFKVYNKETQPLIDFYQKQGILQRVDAAPAPKIVYQSVKKVVEGYLKN